jgi:LacI family transcriptional regulator
LRGIKEFVRGMPGWVLRNLPPSHHAVASMRDWKPDALLLHGDEELWESFAPLSRPTVALLKPNPAAVKTVAIDDVEIGRLAARHLIEQQFRYFAFVGVRQPWSQDRGKGFAHVLQSAGFEPDVFLVRHHAEQLRVHQGVLPVDPEMQRWLTSLPRPCGLFVANDAWGVEVAGTCALAGLHVPEDVAIVGADDDDLRCEMAQPELSSVAVPWRRIGFTAAEALVRYMDDPGKFHPALQLVPPTEVVVRQSSDVVAVSDPDLSSALRYIRRHADQPMGVPDVLRAVPVDRRRLERLFRTALGRSPLAEIYRVKADRAKLLLAQTDWSIPVVADKCGISPKEFARVFRKTTGQMPTEYRQRARYTAPPSG